MTTITVKIPKGTELAVNTYLKEIGAKVVKTKDDSDDDKDDDEVTHGEFFGENIKRVINAFKKD